MKEDKERIEKNERETKSKRGEVSELVEKTRGMETRENELRKELQSLTSKESGLREKISGIEEIVHEKEKILKELRKERELFEKYKKEAEIYEVVAESMDKFIKTLKFTQDQLRDEFLKTVNYMMSQIWSELYPYGDFSEVRMAIDGDYILQLKGTRGWVNVDLVSGGERSMACLALRIAFSLAFTPNLRWLILDEPTHNLDTSAIQHFGEVLRDRLGNFIDQVFLITHEERLSDYITGSLYKLERDKELDGATKIIGV